MRILLAIALLLLAGCPSKQALKGQTSKPSKSPSKAMRALTTKLSRPYPLKLIQFDEFPPAAAAYLEASLNDLMSGGKYAPKDMTLSYMGMVPGCQIGREVILQEVEVSGEKMSPALLTAYMAVDPENCLKYVQRQARAGVLDYLSAIGPDRDVGAWVFEHVHIPADYQGFGDMLMGSILDWGLDPEPYLPNLRFLVSIDDEENKVRRAKVAGYLVLIGVATLEEKQIVIDSLKSDDLMTFIGGIEGLKTAGDPDFADELVGIVANAEMGDMVQGNDPDMKVAFAAYGLTSLGGEQAKMLRQRLLLSTNPMIRMEAALGELLQGDSSYWNSFFESGKISDVDIWTSLKPLDAWHPDLLPFYLSQVNADVLNYRIRVANNLSRYREYANDEIVQEILFNLFDDQEVIVREHAWLIASQLLPEHYLDKALSVLQDEEEHPKVRLAATMCAMAPTIRRVNGRD